MAVSRHQMKMERFIFNEFISNQLFPVDLTKEGEIAACVEKLARVAIVRITMTSNDAIVITSYHYESALTTIASIGLVPLFDEVKFGQEIENQHYNLLVV